MELGEMLKSNAKAADRGDIDRLREKLRGLLSEEEMVVLERHLH